MVKSELKKGNIFLYLIAFVIVSPLFIYFVSMSASFLSGYVSVGLCVFFIGALAFLILRDLRFVMIDKEQGYLKYRSVFRPFVVRVEIKDIVGYVRVIRRGKFGERIEIHLIGNDYGTILMINVLLCENTDELIEALGVPERTDYVTDFWTGKVHLIDKSKDDSPV